MCISLDNSSRDGKAGILLGGAFVYGELGLKFFNAASKHSKWMPKSRLLVSLSIRMGKRNYLFMHIAYQFWENTAVVLLTGFPEGLFTLTMISYLL